MKKKVYIDELENQGTELVNYSKNDISNKINDLSAATNNFVWKGPGYSSYMYQFNSKIDKLNKINENLTLIAEYLTTAKDGYEESNELINKQYEVLLEEYEEIKNEL